MIASHQLTQFRFYIDLFALLGSDPMTKIHRFFQVFGLFKILRVFRISSMIQNSQLEMESKTALMLVKLIFYLCFYIHILACYLWISLEHGQGKRYYWNRDKQEYLSFSGDRLLDPENKPEPGDESMNMKFGPDPTFKDDTSWRRWLPPSQGGILNWESENDKWEARSQVWTMPLDWVNFVD